MYSRRSRVFLTSPVLRRMWPARWLQLPHSPHGPQGSILIVAKGNYNCRWTVVTGGWDSNGNPLSGPGKGLGSAVDLLSGEFLEADEPMEDVMKDAEAAQDKAAEMKDLTEEQQEALEEQAKNQRKAKKQAAREEAAAKWRAANP